MRGNPLRDTPSIEQKRIMGSGPTTEMLSYIRRSAGEQTT